MWGFLRKKATGLQRVNLNIEGKFFEELEKSQKPTKHEETPYILIFVTAVPSK